MKGVKMLNVEFLAKNEFATEQMTKLLGNHWPRNIINPI